MGDLMMIIDALEGVSVYYPDQKERAHLPVSLCETVCASGECRRAGFKWLSII